MSIAALYDEARSDSGLLEVALRIEEVSALAYASAARSLSGRDRGVALAFAEHEKLHAAAFETMLFALTVPVREHAAADDLAEFVPRLGDEPLAALAELEGAALAGHQLMGRRLVELDALRTVAAVMAGAAQHLVVLRRALGDGPVIRAFETGE